MEHGPFIDDFPIKTSVYKRFSMAMLNNQMVGLFMAMIGPQNDNNPWESVMPCGAPVRKLSWLK